MSEALIAAMNSAVNPNPGAAPAASEDPIKTAVTDPATNVDPAAEPVKQDEVVSPRISAIIKREGALLKKERELKQREEELTKSGEGKLTRDELMKSLMDEFEEDPYEFMTKNNFSYEKLQNRLLSGDEGLKVTKLEKRIEALVKQLEEEKTSAKTQAEKDEEASYEANKAKALTHIEQEVLKSDEYELIQKEGAFALVYDVITEYYQETNKILSVSEAAAQVEKHLEDDFKRRLEYNKVKKWTATPIVDPSKLNSSEPSSPKPTQEIKTITSDMIPSGGGTKSDLELTDEERMEKAIRAMKGEKV